MDGLAARARSHVSNETRRLRALNQWNWKMMREQPLQELSGAFGDLGTFIPIFIALAGSASVTGGDFNSPISVSSTLLFSGLANILTGMLFGIPLPVQPMKAIGAVAIARMGSADEFGAAELASAGLFVAGCVGALSLTGLLHLFTRMIPVPVVKGIQVGAGVTLAMKAIPMLHPSAAAFPFDWGGVVLAAVILILLLHVATFARFPFTLAIVGAIAVLMAVNGIIVGATAPWEHDWPWFSIWNPLPMVVPSGAAFGRGALDAGLGQLPLTTLNSVIAVVYLAEDLFPDLHQQGLTPTATSIGTSVALMNLVGCWFRAMPVCHGSGGLAAQYRFGARSGASIIFLGAIKLLLGLFASDFALYFCREFPNILLSLLLFLAGLELAKMGESVNNEGARDLWEEQDDAVLEEEEGTAVQHCRLPRKVRQLSLDERMRRWTVMSATVIALLGAKNDGVGFIVGLVMHGVYSAHDYQVNRWKGREGQIRLGRADE